MTLTPLLILSDSPSACSGLARICRDLATRIATHLSDIYEVATLGYGGFGDKSLPFQQYFIEGMQDWFIPTLPDVWNNFAVGRKGSIFSIWDASRLLWFTRPDLGTNPDKKMCKWLEHPPFKRWGYFPIDAMGPGGMLTVILGQCLLGYDRILAYSNWAQRFIENTLGKEECEKRHLTYLPHGIDTSVFKRRSRAESREIFHKALGFKGPQIRRDEIVIGIVATNQTRKDYGLAISALADVAKAVPLRIFIQIDTLERHWSIPALVMDYGLADHVIVNCGQVSDKVMSYIYSACDLTLGIGGGEGFGYPIFESLACETPVLTGNYGGHAEWMDKEWLLEPEMMRLEGLYNCMRPVFGRRQWANAIIKAIAKMHKLRFGAHASLPEALDWKNNWEYWEDWFRAGYRSLVDQEPAQDHPSSTSETDKGKSVLRSLSTASQEPPGETEERSVSLPPSPEQP